MFGDAAPSEGIITRVLAHIGSCGPGIIVPVLVPRTGKDREAMVIGNWRTGHVLELDGRLQNLAWPVPAKKG
jgi:hypothetical protein